MAESPAQARARLRREKRAGGNATRLQAISALQGGTHRDVKDDVVESRPSPAALPPSGTATPDPEEIDISEHHYTPSSQPRGPSPLAFNGNATSVSGPDQPPQTEQDIMAQMMAQMMGGGGGGIPGSGMPGASGQNDMLASLLSGMQGSEPPPPEKSSAWLWRLVHGLFSLGLAVYIVLQTPFTGSKLARAIQEKDEWEETMSERTFGHFFYLFATFEIVLQTSRYFIEKGQLQGSGILSSIGQFLPPPYAGYVKVIGRYSVIYSTVVTDAMVVVFVLGVASYFGGGAVA